MSSDHVDFCRLLSRTHFAEGFSQRQVGTLAGTARLVSVAAGETLFLEGGWEDNAFVVLTGEIVLRMRVPRRSDLRLLNAVPGDLIGWSGVISEGRMTATAVAATDSTLIALSGRMLQDLCETDPELGCVLMTRIARILSRRLLTTRLQLLDLFCGAGVTEELSAAESEAVIHGAVALSE
jgi:CRP/FNR family transcriptional regulator, cyclic AMP receptor protein